MKRVIVVLMCLVMVCGCVWADAWTDADLYNCDTALGGIYMLYKKGILPLDICFSQAADYTVQHINCLMLNVSSSNLTDDAKNEHRKGYIERLQYICDLALKYYSGEITTEKYAESMTDVIIELLCEIGRMDEFNALLESDWANK